MDASLIYKWMLQLDLKDVIIMLYTSMFFEHSTWERTYEFKK
jgi:hypothetical protein